MRSEVWDKTPIAISNTEQMVIYFKLLKVHGHTNELLEDIEIFVTLTT